MFQCADGLVLGLFSETVFERRFGRLAEGFRGFTLAIHCEDEETVVQAHEAVREFDDFAELDAEPTRSGWGYGFGSATPRATSEASPATTAPTLMTAAASSIRWALRGL